MKLIAILAAVGTFLLIAANSAFAHNGNISVNCSNVTFAFNSFSPGDGDIRYEIDVDNAAVKSGVIVNKSSQTVSIPNPIDGAHVVAAIATWNTGRVETQVNVFCSTKTVTVNVPGPTVYVDKIVTVWGKPTCTTGTQIAAGDGYVVCQVNKTKVVIKKVPGPVRIKKVPGPVRIKKVLVPVPCRADQNWNNVTKKCVPKTPAG